MLNDLNIKLSYSTNQVNIGREFYTPLLSESISYNRVAGYFSSAAFISFSNGIQGLLNNQGKYNLIISSQISEYDYKMIKEGYKNKRSIYEKLENQLNKINVDYKNADTFSKKNLSNLAYLIEIGLVDIKIGFTTSGLFHAKYGLIEDEDGNTVYFSGSLNETGSALNSNYEQISIHKSWAGDEEKVTIEQQKEIFRQLWNGENTDGMIFVRDANELVKNKLMSYSQGNIVVDSELLIDDSLILYYDNGIKIKNNLKNHNIDETNRRIKKLKQKYLLNKELWNFKPEISYSELNTEIIPVLERYSERKKISFVINQSIYEFIESTKFEIEEIEQRGILIKNQDSSLLNEVSKFDEIVRTELTRPLKEVQTWVSFYMSKMHRVSNFSVPGAGKTAMILGTYAYLSSNQINNVDKIVVIAPKNAFISWKDEFQAVFGSKRDLKVLDIHSDSFVEQDMYKNISKYNLILINYESLTKYYTALKNIINIKTMIVFDEIHKIKKVGSERSKIAIELSQNAKYRYSLTGTPIPNSYLDLWNILQILYKDEYNTYFGFSTNELVNPDSYTVNKINKSIHPFYWRVTKKELNVPPANDDVVLKYVSSDAEQKLINLLWDKYKRNPLVLYLRLVQTASNPDLLKKRLNKNIVDSREEETSDEFLLDSLEDEGLSNEYEINLINQINKSSKFEACVYKADQLVKENKTVVIWCYFIDTIGKLLKQLSNMNHKVAAIYGNLTSDERNDIIHDFQLNKYDILITNPHTLAESVSLHKVCHNAIYLEWSFNLTHMLQSRDRIHRLGLSQNQETNYFYFMLEGQSGQSKTIDEKMYNRLKEKANIMYESIEGETLATEWREDEKQEIIEMMNEELK